VSPERIVLDSNFLIRHGVERLGPRSLLSAVVLQEVVAGARDIAGVRALGELSRRYDLAGRLLVPTGEDWWFAGKVLNALYRGLPSHRHGPTPAIPKEEQQRLLRDVLIARSAKRVNAAVSTYNTADFMKIRKFCNVRMVPPEEILAL
jgi:predicted nucleic acid-binding protein